jgi:hypothetical protein
VFQSDISGVEMSLGTAPSVRNALAVLNNADVSNALAEKCQRCTVGSHVSKWLIDRAHLYNLRLEAMHCYHYQRYPGGLEPYSIYTQVFEFAKGEVSPIRLPTKGTPKQVWMESDIVSCIRKHRCIDVEEVLCASAEKVPTIFDDFRNEIEALCRLTD